MPRNHRARCAAVVLLASFATSACTVPGGGDANALVSCEEILPEGMAAEILGDEAGRLVKVDIEEPDPVSPLVNQMVGDGIACGGIVSGKPALDGAVMVGQLSMDEARWNELKKDSASDGREVLDFEGVHDWVDVPRAKNDPIGGSGFAWKDQVLYYAMSPVLLTFVPAFAS